MHRSPSLPSECAAIGLSRIDAVPIHGDGRVVVGNHSWRQGHYKYAECAAPRSPATSISLTVLMMANHLYAAMVPGWAAKVRSINASCVVGAVGPERGMCALARSVGCGCMNSSTPVLLNDGWGRNSARARAVKDRFRQARELLASRKQAVLMHDADLFYRADDLEGLLRRLAPGLRPPHGTAAAAAMAAAPADGLVDFVVSPNGARAEAYDDLNWGFVYISGSQTSLDLFDCLLASWEHRAFLAPSPGRDKSYYGRSQPRINHLIEQSIEEAARAERGAAAAAARGRAPGARRVSLCTVPPAEFHGAVRHMTGFASARHKLMCALSEGVHGRDARGGVQGARALLYRAPRNASVAQQRTALLAALALANQTERALSLPRSAWWGGRTVPFCQLFDVSELPMPPRVGASVSKGHASAACAAPLAPAAVAASAERLLCVGFDALLARAGSRSALVTSVYGSSAEWTSVYACPKPWAKHVLGMHHCSRAKEEALGGRARARSQAAKPPRAQRRAARQAKVAAKGAAGGVARSAAAQDTHAAVGAELSAAPVDARPARPRPRRPMADQRGRGASLNSGGGAQRWPWLRKALSS